MLQIPQEEIIVPQKPHLRPIEDIEIEEFSLEMEHMCLEESETDPSDNDFKISEETSLEEDRMSLELQSRDRSTPKRRHEDLEDMVGQRRSMLVKLQRLDRVPTKRRHYG